MDEKKNAYAYLRVSTGKQIDNYSLDGQQYDINRYCEYNNINLIKIFREEGKSGKDFDNRDTYQQMKKEILSLNDEKIDYVIVYDISRFARTLLGTLQEIDELNKNGVALISLKEGIDTSNSSSKLFLSIMATMAEQEREKILYTTQHGRDEQARKGRWCGGEAPYGYQLVADGNKKKLVINEYEAQHIRMIFDMYVNRNLGFVQIAKELKRIGIVKVIRNNSKCDCFEPHSIRKIVGNPIYMGQIIYGRRSNNKRKKDNREVIIADGIHEAIIDEMTFNRAQEKIKRNQKIYEKKTNLDHEHLLSAILVCPKCGGRMYGYVNRKKKRGTDEYYKDFFYYTCKHQFFVGNQKCNFKKQVHQEKLNNAVLEVIKNLAFNTKIIKQMEKVLNDNIDAEEIKHNIFALNQSIDKLKAKSNKYLELIADLDADDDNYELKKQGYEELYKEEVERIATSKIKIKELEEEISKISHFNVDMNQISDFLKNFDELFYLMPEIEKKKMLQAFINKVEINEEPKNKQILKSIDFRFPLTYNGNIDKIFTPIVPTKGTGVETVCKLLKK